MPSILYSEYVREYYRANSVAMVIMIHCCVVFFSCTMVCIIFFQTTFQCEEVETS